MKAAVFSTSLSCQIANFRRSGFVLIRKPPSLTSQCVESINSEVLHQLEESESSMQYRFWRFCNSVSTPLKRHSIPLKFTPGVRQLLDTNISHIFPFLESQLLKDAPLVELSAIISQSGSSIQETHSDVPLSSPLILSAFIALTRVTLENGPTCMYQGSHTAAFHHAKAEPVANTQKYYSSDGYDEDVLEYKNNLKLGGTQSNAEDISEAYPPFFAVLEPGDMLLFDTKIAHHGMANTSLLPRSLLCFAFQQPDVIYGSDSDSPSQPGVHCETPSEDYMVNDEVISVRDSNCSPHRVAAVASVPKVEGFTYHCDVSMTREKITLRDYTCI